MYKITKRERERENKKDKLNLNIKMTRRDTKESAKKTNHAYERKKKTLNKRQEQKSEKGER